jgi:DNA-binding SARP family transcriptional activator
MTIRLLTLGGLHGRHGDAELGWLRSQWLRAALLSYLTVERQSTRETLQAMFWPESDAETAAHRLSQTVYAVRRALGDDCIETRGRELHAGDQLEADVLEFDRHIKNGNLREAIALYRGPFLNGVHLADTKDFENWVDARRAQYARQFRKACRAHVDACAAGGNLAEALTAARAWVAPDPFDDEAQHRLIELLAQTGLRTDARKQYEEYAKVLDADGLQPLDQTRELIAALDKTPPVLPVLTATGAVDPRPSHAQPEPVSAPTQAPIGKRRSRLWPAAVLLATLTLVVVVRMPGRDRRVFDESPPSLAIAILPIISGTADHQLDRLALGLESQLSSVLTEVAGLDVRPTESVRARQAQNFTLDSIALVTPVDYFIRATLSYDQRDSLVVTLELVEAGIRSVGAGHVRVARNNVLEDLAERVADRLRPTLGARIQARQLERGTSHPIALQRRRQAEHFRQLAIKAMEKSDPAAAERAFDSARDLLIESQNIDPNWPAPRLARAALSSNRGLAIFSASRGRDRRGFQSALNEGLVIVDSVLRKWPELPAALAMRGRLRWTRIQIADPAARAANLAIDSTAADLRRALDRDSTLAGAAADLSNLLFKVRADYNDAALWAQRAYDADIYMEERERSDIINHLAMTRLEVGDDYSAARLCAEGLRQFPDNPAHYGCVLDIMAWGDGPAQPDSARKYFHSLEARRAPGNLAAHAEYSLALAAALARAGKPNDARNVLNRVLTVIADSAGSDDGLRTSLLGRQAGVYFRLADSAQGRKVFAEFASRVPDDARILASRRVLRAFVDSKQATNPQ